MVDDGFDVIRGGSARAGSPTAMLLARNGYRVLVVDRATFPSRHPLHALCCNRWGWRRCNGGACWTS